MQMNLLYIYILYICVYSVLYPLFPYIPILKYWITQCLANLNTDAYFMNLPCLKSIGMDNYKQYGGHMVAVRFLINEGPYWERWYFGVIYAPAPRAGFVYIYYPSAAEMGQLDL